MVVQRLTTAIPVVRDIVFLAVGTYVFVAEARADGRWGPMLLGMLFAAGPSVVSAYWSTAHTRGSGSPGSSVSPSPPPLPSPSSSGGEP